MWTWSQNLGDTTDRLLCQREDRSPQLELIAIIALEKLYFKAISNTSKCNDLPIQSLSSFVQATGQAIVNQGSLQNFLKSCVNIHFTNTGCGRHIISINTKYTNNMYRRNEEKIASKELYSDLTESRRLSRTLPRQTCLILRAELLTVENKKRKITMKHPSFTLCEIIDDFLTWCERFSRDCNAYMMRGSFSKLFLPVEKDERRKSRVFVVVPSAFLHKLNRELAAFNSKSITNAWLYFFQLAEL